MIYFSGFKELRDRVVVVGMAPQLITDATTNLAEFYVNVTFQLQKHAQKKMLQD